MVSSMLPYSAGKGLEHPTIVPLSVPLSSGRLRKSSSVAVRRTSNTPPRSLYSEPESSQFFSSPRAMPHFLFVHNSIPYSRAQTFEHYRFELQISTCAPVSHFFPWRGRTVRPPVHPIPKKRHTIPANFKSTYCHTPTQNKNGSQDTGKVYD